MAFSIDFKILRYSITNTLEITELKKDTSEPYSFIDFVKNLDIDNINNEFVVDSYNKYIVEWSKIKNQSSQSFEGIRKQKYVDLLKTIQLNYITQDEERILGNIDYENPLEVEVAIPFFVEKIKDLIEYYIVKRRDVKNSKVKWSTKGSKEFLKKEISKFIIDNYTKNENTFQKYKQTYQELSSFQNKYSIEYDGLYDLNDYRGVEFTFDPSKFLSSSEDYELTSLSILDFGDYNPSSETIIDEIKKDLYKKYISVDHTYYSNGLPLLIKSNTPFYDPYNYELPLISRISDNTNLLRDKDIGYYFTSKYIYSSNYFSPYGISIKDTSKYTGLLPTLDRYRSQDYVDYYLWSKYSHVHQGLVGKPISDYRLKRFHGYQTRDNNLGGDSSGGVERFTDDIQIWGGDKNNTWLNEDIFNKFTNNILNRKSKTSFFFNLKDGESVYKYCADIYGNEYYLIKKQKDFNTLQSNVYSLPTTVANDNIVAANFGLIGQRITPTSELINIQISDNIGLGFFINISDFSNSVVESLSDFNVSLIDIKPLNSTLFQTITSNDIYSNYDNKKSLYETYYEEGRLIIRDSNSRYIGQLSSFVGNIFDDESIYNDVNNRVLNIDIVDDTLLLTTPNNIFTTKISYNFSTSQIRFLNITKNSISFYNRSLRKTALYWHSLKTNFIYFAELSGNSTKIYPTINYLDIDTNTYLEFKIEDGGESYAINNLISIESLSRPCVVKHGNNLFVVSILKDICDNYYYHIFKYEFITKTYLRLIYNKVYKPNLLKVDTPILTDTLAQDNLSSVFDEIISDIASNTIYINSDTLELKKEELPTYTDSEETYYDNDKKSIIDKEKPNFTYKLSELISNKTPIINTTSSENFYIYDNTETSMPFIYNNSDIELNFRAIKDFPLYISQDEFVYKIEYILGNKIITKHILSQSEVDYVNDILNEESGSSELSAYAINSLSGIELSAISVTNEYSSILATGKYSFTEDVGVYNDKFVLSPINMKYITYNNRGGNTFQIIFYSTTKKYRFQFTFNDVLLSVKDVFSKLELLDARIKSNLDGTNDMLIYINSRSPNYILANSIINI